MPDTLPSHDALRTATPTPIAQLCPDLSDPQTRAVHGDVTITWPFSLVTKSIAFIVAERDFRLRRDKGQVRVKFHGAAAKAIADASLGGGDEVRLSLKGVEWAKNESNTQIGGSTLEWQLEFTSCLTLLVRRAGSQEEAVIDIETSNAEVDDHPDPSSSLDEQPSTSNLAIPIPASPERPISAKRPASFLESNEFASPAFIKRARVSYGSLFEGLDIFDEDVQRKKKKKKSRFSLPANSWRYSSRSPSPEAESEPDEESNKPVVDGCNGEAGTDKPVPEAEDAPMSTPLRPAMVDGGCQTVESDLTPMRSVQASAEHRPAPFAFPFGTPTPLPRQRVSETANTILDHAGQLQASLSEGHTPNELHDSFLGHSPAHGDTGVLFGFATAQPVTYPPPSPFSISRGEEPLHGHAFHVPEAYPTSFLDHTLPTADAEPHSALQSHDSHSEHDGPQQSGTSFGSGSHLFSSFEEARQSAHDAWSTGPPTSFPTTIASHDVHHPMEIPSSPSETGRAQDKELPSSPAEMTGLTFGRQQPEIGVSNIPEDKSDAGSGHYRDGGDRPGDDYDLRNYDRAHDDDDEVDESEEERDIDPQDPDDQIINPDENADSEEVDDEEEMGSDEEVADYDTQDEGDAEGEFYSEEEGYDEEGYYETDAESEEGDEAPPPAAPANPVVISLLSDSEDEDDEPAPEPAAAAEPESEPEPEPALQSPEETTTEQFDVVGVEAESEEVGEGEKGPNFTAGRESPAAPELPKEPGPTNEMNELAQTNGPAESKTPTEPTLTGANGSTLLEAKEPDVPDAEEPDVSMAEGSNMPEAEEADVSMAEEPDVPQAKEPAPPEAKEPALLEVQEPVPPEAKEPDVPDAEEPDVSMAEEPDVPQPEGPDVPEAKGTTPPEAKEPALPEAEAPVLPEAEEPTLLEVQEPDVPQAKETAPPEAKEPALLEVQEPVLPEAKESAVPQAEEPDVPEAKEAARLEVQEPAPTEAKEPALPEAEAPVLPEADELTLPEAKELTLPGSNKPEEPPQAEQLEQPQQLQQSETEKPEDMEKPESPVAADEMDVDESPSEPPMTWKTTEDVDSAETAHVEADEQETTNQQALAQPVIASDQREPNGQRNDEPESCAVGAQSPDQTLEVASATVEAVEIRVEKANDLDGIEHLEDAQPTAGKAVDLAEAMDIDETNDGQATPDNLEMCDTNAAVTEVRGAIAEATPRPPTAPTAPMSPRRINQAPTSAGSPTTPGNGVKASPLASAPAQEIEPIQDGADPSMETQGQGEVYSADATMEDASALETDNGEGMDGQISPPATLDAHAQPSQQDGEPTLSPSQDSWTFLDQAHHEHLPTPGETQEDDFTEQHRDQGSEEDLSPEDQIMAEIQQRSPIRYTKPRRLLHPAAASPTKPGPGPGLTETTTDEAVSTDIAPKSDVLITAKSLRSRAKSKSADLSHVDTSASLAKAPSSPLPKQAADDVKVKSTTPTTLRITRSSKASDHADPSIQLARANLTLAKGKAGEVSNNSPPPPKLRISRSRVDLADPSVQLAKGTPVVSTRQTRSLVTPERPSRNARSSSRGVGPGANTPDTAASVPSVLYSPSVAGSSAAVQEDETASTLRLQLLKEVRTNLPDFLPLKKLKNSLNQAADVLAVATTTPAQPHRPKHGPRDYMLTLNLTDPSVGPRAVAVAHIFRPHQSSLPVVKAGDVVLLRRVLVVSMKGRGFGVRASEASAWAVFESGRGDGDDEDNEARLLPQIKGPPVEVVEAEVAYVEGLRRWWNLLDGKAMETMERANRRVAEAGKEDGR